MGTWPSSCPRALARWPHAGLLHLLFHGRVLLCLVRPRNPTGATASFPLQLLRRGPSKNDPPAEASHGPAQPAALHRTTFRVNRDRRPTPASGRAAADTRSLSAEPPIGE